jgi:hypothetical protein
MVGQFTMWALQDATDNLERRLPSNILMRDMGALS